MRKLLHQFHPVTDSLQKRDSAELFMNMVIYAHALMFRDRLRRCSFNRQGTSSTAASAKITEYLSVDS